MDVFDTDKLDQVKETNFAKNFEVVEVNGILHGFEIRHKETGKFIVYKPTYKEAELVRRQM